MMLPLLDILRKPVVHRVDGLVDLGVAGVLLFGGGEGLAVASVEALGRGVPAWEHGRIDEAACASFVVASLVISDGAVVDWSGLACPSAAASSSGLASQSSSSSSPNPESEISASTMRSMGDFTFLSGSWHASRQVGQPPARCRC